MVNPILVALDLPDLDEAEEMARRLEGHVGGFKVGLELLMGSGPTAISRIAALGLPVFADAKLHDIPNTVEGACRELSSRGARWVSVHALGGASMMEAAVIGLEEGSGDRRSGALAITVLTSMDEAALESVGIEGTIETAVSGLCRLAAFSGAEGVVCSPHEIGLVKGVSKDLVTVTPGIRPPGVESHDQRRVATPSEALSAGADWLVVGRAITAYPDPVEAARALAEEIG